MLVALDRCGRGRLLTCLCAVSQCIAGCASSREQPQQEVIFHGRCRVQTSAGAVPADYSLVKSADGEQLSLTVGSPVGTAVWTGDIGQTFPTAVYGRLYPGVGNLLTLEAEDGASMIRLVLIHLVDGRESSIVFDERSRFGFDIVDLDGDADVEIVEVDGDLTGPKHLRIFSWNGSRYVQESERQSANFPHYNLVTNP